jgi:hypothetical protein
MENRAACIMQGARELPEQHSRLRLDQGDRDEVSGLDSSVPWTPSRRGHQSNLTASEENGRGEWFGGITGMSSGLIASMRRWR